LTVTHTEPSHPAPLPSAQVVHQAVTIFGLLSATVRLQLVWLLAGGEQDVGTLAEQVGQSVATVSHHLAKLKLAGIVRARRDGKRQVHYVENPTIIELVRLGIADQATSSGEHRVTTRGA
jgi:DNA-binding transcriptional ArsR family regulator